MGLCLPDERPAKLPATGSKRDRGSEAVVEGDDSGDAMQPPTAKRPSRPAPPRQPSRRQGQSTPSGPSVAAPQSASTTGRRTDQPSPARESPPGGPTGGGRCPRLFHHRTSPRVRLVGRGQRFPPTPVRRREVQGSGPGPPASRPRCARRKRRVWTSSPAVSRKRARSSC